MKRQLHDMWKEKYGTKTIWKIQAPKGILSFTRKSDAIKWVASMERGK